MTPEEWIDVVRLVNANWPHSQVPDASLEKWYHDLADVDAAEVAGAVEALYREGREFPPNGGQIRAKAVALAADAPDWSVVWAAVRRYVATGVCNPMYHQSNYAGRDSDHHPTQRAARLLGRMEPMAAAFIESMTSSQLSDALEQEGGGEARLREKWQAWSGRLQREETLRGLPGERGTLARVNGAPSRLAEIAPEALRLIEEAP